MKFKAELGFSSGDGGCAPVDLLAQRQGIYSLSPPFSHANIPSQNLLVA